MKPNIIQDYMVTEDNFSTSPYANRKYDVSDYKRPTSRIDKIIIHCTATDSKLWDDSDRNGVEDPLALINFDIKGNTGNPRLPKKGCPTSTYHFYIPKAGSIFQLVSMNIETMNARGYNRESVAICINDSGSQGSLPDEQYVSLTNAICHVVDFLDLPYDLEELNQVIWFHRDLDPSKTCPGYKLVKSSLIKDVYDVLQTWGDNA